MIKMTWILILPFTGSINACAYFFPFPQIWVLFDLLRYSTIVCQEICEYLGIYCFCITSKPKPLQNNGSIDWVAPITAANVFITSFVTNKKHVLFFNLILGCRYFIQDPCILFCNDLIHLKTQVFVLHCHHHCCHRDHCHNIRYDYSWTRTGWYSRDKGGQLSCVFVVIIMEHGRNI